MALIKTLTKLASKNHHNFTLTVSEDSTTSTTSLLSFTFEISQATSSTYRWSGWGTSIAYQITIDQQTFTGYIPKYYQSTPLILKTESNIEIQHETDGTKTINIGFTVTDTTGESYTCGNATASTTFELTRLHKPPIISNITFAEEGTALSGVTGKQFVEFLSKKRITITATPQQDIQGETITITGYKVINGENVFTSSTNQVVCDFSNKKIFINTTTNTPEIKIQVEDSIGGVAEQIITDNTYVEYFKPTMITTSSNIKRKGQVSGKVILNALGTFYNDTIGNTQNNISLSYAYWKKGSSESTTYITIPSTAYTITNNNISISNWTVLNNGSEISDVDPSFAYYFKIKIADAFNNETTITLLCTEGEYIWCEFPDHVDFRNLTYQHTPLIETDSNNDGTFIKFFDGTMICMHSITQQTLAGTSAFGSATVAYNIYSWTYPEQFTQILSVQVTAVDEDAGSFTAEVENVTTTGMNIILLGTSGKKCGAYMTVIGKWK